MFSTGVYIYTPVENIAVTPVLDSSYVNEKFPVMWIDKFPNQYLLFSQHVFFYIYIYIYIYTS
jgi:hypothetical protein